MANHPSALKRHRQSLKRKARNQLVKTALRGQLKELRAAIAAKDSKKSAEHLKATTRALAKAAAKGVIPKKRADRQISRLSTCVSSLTA